MDGAGFRSRLFLAYTLWQGRRGRKLSQTELGLMLGKVGGEVASQSRVSDWFRNTIPSVEDLEYLAKALEVDPGWLAFGKSSKAPGPHDPMLVAMEPVPPRKKR